MVKNNTNNSTASSFATYIETCRKLIHERRTDLHQPHADVKQIIAANCPFEYKPRPSTSTIRRGALLIHGLLASPFCMHEIGQALQSAGMLARAVLLPGHGTQPADLMSVTYNDWINTVRYGIETLYQEVEHVYLVGYSLGAALAIYHAMKDPRIAGIVLLAPAIKIKVPYSVIISWHFLLQKLSPTKQWIYRDEELDYAKYLSLPYNAVKQIIELTDIINKKQKADLQCPALMISSAQDETISHRRAAAFFASLSHPDNELLIYTDKHINSVKGSHCIERKSTYKKRHIEHLSHIGVPFSPANHHYGQTGDYIFASHKETQFPTYYGAYNQFEVDMHAQLFKFGFNKHQRRVLTYNPDFDYMAEKIVKFVGG